MQPASDLTATDDTVLDECWDCYATAELPPHCGDFEVKLARNAFFGGARTLYELLSRLQALAELRGDGPLDLVRAGRLLGLEDDMALNG